MKPTPQGTRTFLLIWFFVLAMYAAYAGFFGGRAASVSLAMSDFCSEHPIAALALGAVLGHILWRL